MSKKLQRLTAFGSSLRAQGTLTSVEITLENGRFIPAGAGNTQFFLGEFRARAVHPCGRREHLDKSPQHVGQYGSSLRAQGTHRYFKYCHFTQRFIPAGAGNTAIPPAVNSSITVHPCGRREHFSIFRSY